MAQPEQVDVKVKILVDADVSAIRRRVKHIRTEIEELNRDLARLQENLGTYGGMLAGLGIGLEVGDD